MKGKNPLISLTSHSLEKYKKKLEHEEGNEKKKKRVYFNFKKIELTNELSKRST
jgi:hypothetical protein